MYTLVIVDDEPNILEGIKRLLDWKSLGFGRIETARSSMEVMSHILDWRPDICLMDVCIGNDKGYEVINCLNNLGVHSNYVMMSGYDEFSYACEAIRCGALDYLLKPVEKKKLLEVVKKIIVERLHGTLPEEDEKKKLTKKIAKELLDKGWCRVTGLYTPKKPQFYDAVIRLDDSGGKYVSFKMEFDK